MRRTHEHNSVLFHLPEDTLKCFCSVYIWDAHFFFQAFGGSNGSELNDCEIKGKENDPF